MELIKSNKAQGVRRLSSVKAQGVRRLSSVKAQGVRRLSSVKAQGVRRLSSVKAQGHVEIIISFVLFVGVLIFLFVFFNPISSSPQKNSDLDRIYRLILNNLSEEVGKLSIIKEPGGCYDFSVIDYPGNYIEVIDSSGRKVTVYVSDNFPPNSISRVAGCADSYTIGVYIKEEMLRYERLANLANNYKTDYVITRNNLGIIDNFMFSVKSFEGEIISDLSVSKDIPYSVDVVSIEFPIRVLDNQGDIHQLIINIQSW
jgi:hypothetical protein